MAWKKTTDIASTQLNRRGLAGTLAAAAVCREAERLYPGLFHAISLKNGVLHVELPKENQLQLVMVEGKLLQDLQPVAGSYGLTAPVRLRLTFSE